MVGSTQICGHTNFVFGWKLGCDNNYVIASPTPPKQAVPTVQPSTPKLTPPPTFRKTGKIGKEEEEYMAKSGQKSNGWLVGNKRTRRLERIPETSPPTPQNSYPKFRNPRTTFGNTPLCPPIYSIGCGILIFLLLRASCQVLKS